MNFGAQRYEEGRAESRHLLDLGRSDAEGTEDWHSRITRREPLAKRNIVECEKMQRHESVTERICTRPWRSVVAVGADIMRFPLMISSRSESSYTRLSASFYE